MSLFKKKSTPAQSQNIQANIVPVTSGVDPVRQTQTFVIEIQANNADLLNENVNDIELATEIKPLAPSQKPSTGNLSEYLKESVTLERSPKTRSIGNIDPKATVSHGDLGRLATTPITDNIIKESMVYSERRFAEVPLQNQKASLVQKGRISFNNRNTAAVATKDCMHTGVFDAGTSFKSRNFSTPVVKGITTEVLPKKTTILSQVTVGKNEKVKLNLKDSNGKIIGSVGNSAKNITLPLETQDLQKLLPAFKVLSSNPEPFKIDVSNNEYGFCLHVVSRFPSIFNKFQIYARYVSEYPGNDRYKLLGTYNRKTGRRIILNASPDKTLIFHVVPIYKGKPLCFSQTKIHVGIESQSVTRICGYQTTVPGRESSAMVFKIYRYPSSARKLYVIRSEANSGERLRYAYETLPANEDTPGITSNDYDWVDYKIGTKNKIYSYDFFTVDSYGFETHLGNYTARVFEKDTIGITFTGMSIAYSKSNGHQIKFRMNIPDLWIPEQNDSLVNPGDNIIESAREGKRIGLVQLVRHCDSEPSQIAGTFVVNPGKNISEIPITLLENGEIEGLFEVNSAFSRKNNLGPIAEELEYIYELRAGYYSLSNELSFLKNPIKLTVPNEHTSGKVGYSYHPYLFESPLSKDYSIIPKLGEDKHFLQTESLTSTSKVAYFDAAARFKKIPSIKCSLGANRFGNQKVRPYVTITSSLEKNSLRWLDHIEILVANSTDGTWLTLGCHKVDTTNFVFIDDVGPSLACNKIKYCIIGRSLSFDEVFRAAGDTISLKKYNYIERDDVSSNSISLDPRINSRLR
mgnify:CR=1 FL=1